MRARYDVSVSYISIVIVNVKIDDIQTNRQTESAKKYAPIIRFRGIKRLSAKMLFDAYIEGTV